MAQFIADITNNRWVIVAKDRSRRPTDATSGVNVNKICVFCPGFEKIPGVELYRIGSGQAYEPGWQVRVIRNKYPITDFHEVIIHSPDDKADIDKLETAQVAKIIEAYRARYNYHGGNGQVIIFNNVGEVAGASIGHPHSQLVVVPKQIKLDALALEPIVNVIEDNPQFVVYCPKFSQWPFEVWIAPKVGGELFGQISDGAIGELAKVLKNTLNRLITHLLREDEMKCHFHPGVPAVSFKGGLAYNFYIHHGKDWYLRIIPRLIRRAGFEFGSGISVNMVDPADAAKVLKQEKI